MLPKHVDPRRLAEQGVAYKEEIAISDLPRIEEIAETSAEQVTVEIEFFRDEQSRVRVTGSVSGSIGQICQRCMDVVDVSFQQTMDLVVVWNDDQSKAVPRDLDPWQIGSEIGEKANLLELIEDEILLALPVVVRHPVGECEAPEIAQIEISEAQDEGRQRPFEVLKDLKKG